MSQSTQRQRLEELRDALEILSSEKILSHRDIFPGKREAWHYRLLTRLIKEELIIRLSSGKSMTSVQYQAVDGSWFASLIKDGIKLAEWYLKRGVPESVAAEIQEPPPTNPEPQVMRQEQDVPSRILDTLILCAENLVYIRNRLDALHDKLDTLTSKSDTMSEEV